jgi:transcriptional regulator with XRE-family HTH domain
LGDEWDEAKRKPAAGWFASNLRLLAERETSIVALCSAIGINRQQFNKYLSGCHEPSRRNLTNIAAHFGVSEKDLFLPPEAFAAIYAIQRQPIVSLLAGAPKLAQFVDRLPSSLRATRDKVGVYWKYHCSSIYERQVLRSVVRLTERDGLIQYETVERFQDMDSPHRTAYRFRYQGLCFSLEDRIFLIDAEVRQHNEMTFSVLMPIVRKPQRFLFGLTVGIAATAFREPYATRVAFHHAGVDEIGKRQFAQCKALAAEDKSIPTEIRSYLMSGKGRTGEILRGI